MNDVDITLSHPSLLILELFFKIIFFFHQCLDVIGPTVLAVGRPNREQHCLTEFTCTQTCGPYNATPTSHDFVVYDLGSVKRLGLIEIKFNNDISFRVQTLRSGVSWSTCHNYTLGAGADKKTIASCAGNEARFIKVVTSSLADTLEICYFRYYLQGIFSLSIFLSTIKKSNLKRSFFT